MNVSLELWAQLFQENLGTCLLAIKLEGTLFQSQTPLDAPIGCFARKKFTLDSDFNARWIK